VTVTAEPPPVADPGPDANDRAFLQALRGAQINIGNQSDAQWTDALAGAP
jgi:hypothetical protein